MVLRRNILIKAELKNLGTESGAGAHRLIGAGNEQIRALTAPAIYKQPVPMH